MTPATGSLGPFCLLLVRALDPGRRAARRLIFLSLLLFDSQHRGRIIDECAKPAGEEWQERHKGEIVQANRALWLSPWFPDGPPTTCHANQTAWTTRLPAELVCVA